MHHVYPKLPKSLQEVVEVIGRRQTIHLITHWPPCKYRSRAVSIYVPKKLPSNHRLVKILGWEAAKRMSNEFPGMILNLPRYASLLRSYRNQFIAAMAADGIPVELIAKQVGLSVKQVVNVVSN